MPATDASLDHLENSTQDDVSLAAALQERFLTVCERFQRKWGMDIEFPKEITQAIFAWRTCVARYRKKDFRHKASEKKYVRILAQWTVDENCKLCGTPIKKIEFGD
jgi:hypothetical protein